MIRTEDCIPVGKIIKSHNLQGEVVIFTENDLLEEYAEEPVFISLEGAPVPFFIADEGISVRNRNTYIVKFDFVDTLEQAERLIGHEVLLPKDLFPEIEEDGEADVDIETLKEFEVEDERSGRTGRLLDVADYSGNVVFTIAIWDKEILLPFSEDYIKRIDFEEKKLIVFIPQEIIDLY